MKTRGKVVMDFWGHEWGLDWGYTEPGGFIILQVAAKGKVLGIGFDIDFSLSTK